LSTNFNGSCGNSVWKRELKAVVRNVHEDLMGVISIPIIIGCLSATIAQLLAIREVIRFQREAGYNSLVVESDVKIAINNSVSGNEAFEIARGLSMTSTCYLEMLLLFLLSLFSYCVILWLIDLLSFL
ncbi:unnamed protein product, partial [Prunus brigantina]